MLHTARTSPETFFAVWSKLLPRDVAISIQAQAPILDAGDLAILKAIKAAIPDAGAREPQEVFNLALDALRSYLAKPIPPVSQTDGLENNPMISTSDSFPKGR